MKLSRKLMALAAPLALLAVGGCATPFNAQVARFQRMPVPQGQSFRIVPANARNNGGLEFATYAQSVAQHLAQQGYRPVMGGGPADMIVQLDYGVGQAREKVTTTPGIDCGFGGFGPWGGYGFGGFGWRYGWGGGFGGPFGYGGYGGFGCPDVESYTVFSSFLTMTITGSDGSRLFEGRARAHSTTDNLTVLVPNLIDAMFTGFPGNSGQDIRISISPQQQKERAMQQGRGYAPPPPAGPTS